MENPVKGMKSMENRLKKCAARYEKLGITNYQDAVRYEENKLDKLLKKCQ